MTVNSSGQTERKKKKKGFPALGTGLTASSDDNTPLILLSTLHRIILLQSNSPDYPSSFSPLVFVNLQILQTCPRTFFFELKESSATPVARHHCGRCDKKTRAINHPNGTASRPLLQRRHVALERQRRMTISLINSQIKSQGHDYFITANCKEDSDTSANRGHTRRLSTPSFNDVELIRNRVLL